MSVTITKGRSQGIYYVNDRVVITDDHRNVIAQGRLNQSELTALKNYLKAAPVKRKKSHS